MNWLTVWFTKKRVSDEEKAVSPEPPNSPTGTNLSGKPLIPAGRLSSWVSLRSQCTEKENTTSGARATEKLERKQKAQALKEATTSITSISLKERPLGYPRCAAFQSSEACFSIYRSFDYLHSRVILGMQDDLRQLENKLNRLDTNEEEERALKSNREAGTERLGLLADIRDKLIKYDEILMKARDMNGFQRPSDRDYASLRNWYHRQNPLLAHDRAFIKLREDLVTLRQGREWAGFDGWIESTINKLPPRVKDLFTTKELKEKSDDPILTYYSPSRIEKLVGIFITLIIFVLLILPVIAMYKLTSVGNRNSTIDAVGLLVVFTLLFSAAMSLLTKAKRHELFAASAAYCAVLVVFISNFNNENGGIVRVA
ncbi:hypothetical protein OPT61_g3286 [Boeremia exigua]|uniref:Uncharacterized protein n=1 Tax=Boeremia exigua TaxID=749465 RepID=A0ACC2IIF6_9PLEO|nr:hypothetical protein OPT61_g3286 [Boeremia exigua]